VHGLDSIFGCEPSHNQCQFAVLGSLYWSPVNPLYVLWNTTANTNHFDNKFTSLHDLTTLIHEVKTKYSKAGLPLDPALAAIMLRWKAQSEFTDDEDWVFASWRTLGKKPLRSTSVLENVLKPAAERAGLGLIGWHTFRRTFSTLLRGNGEDIKVQQELMRHSDIRTTMNLYTQANSDQKRQAQGKIVQMVLVGESADCSPVLPRPSGTC
jgi:Phage integrase family